MFPPSRFRALASSSVVALIALTASCDQATRKSAENSGAGDCSSASAGAAGDANDDASGGASASASAGTSATDDSSYAGNASADGECQSGQTRCHGQLGFQRCTPDGVWGASISCGGYSENGTSSYCAVFDAGDGPWAACVDPACWWWKQSGLDASEQRSGVCVSDTEIRRCQGGILIRTPEPCAGVCRRVAELDGRVLGYCDATCDDGDRECLGGALYRVCEKARWSTQPQSCADGELCQPLAQSAQPDIECGGACQVGTARCSDDGTSVQTCSDAHEWVEASPCMLGRCVQSAAQAQCQTECQKGEHACAFDGAAAERTCGASGLWNEPVACAAGATCRVGMAGSLGCMTCVGSEARGGNAWGVNDSHCGDSGLAQCGADNTYTAGEPCDDGQVCAELTRGAATIAYCK